MQHALQPTLSAGLLALARARPADPVTWLAEYLLAHRPARAAERGTALAFALGGSSDVIGALASARALGFSKVVLVQPGSPPRGTPSPTLELQRVEAVAADAPAPGGNFFDNGSMVAYLLSRDADDLVAGYYLAQPKDDGKGFSAAAVDATAAALAEVIAAHGCSASPSSRPRVPGVEGSTDTT